MSDQLWISEFFEPANPLPKTLMQSPGNGNADALDSDKLLFAEADCSNGNNEHGDIPLMKLDLLHPTNTAYKSLYRNTLCPPVVYRPDLPQLFFAVNQASSPYADPHNAARLSEIHPPLNSQLHAQIY
ncbi:MAG TPA: hypothetical protein VL987_10105 [Cellvibrio sp.]|nr:hypothetical protein [Cellvibrio sp.]